MSCLRCLCLFASSCVQRTLFCVSVYLRLAYPVLPAYLDCPFLVAPSVFSNVYIEYSRKN
jgi:hypothetical protein